MRILVVDDEPAVREALERILRLDGFEVAMACDERAAVRSQAAAPADAVLLDVLMPGLDGLEVCRRMRDIGDRVAGLEAGADDYLSKPFALEELLARLRALLRRCAEHELTVRLHLRKSWRTHRSRSRPSASPHAGPSSI